ncbi:OmpP1/FadL family transporter [Dinoroseobacter sp. S124A]|uniref:OmpP1/FadL family transporter n=1 Tax=Dinoroseobacter sp. S124A TaxID=3415128 RepID=UPI003C7C2774
MQTTRLALLGGAAMALASSAYAGGVERSNQGIDFLFEQGTYVELGFGRLDPDVSGEVVQPGFGNANSGNMLGGENVFSLSYKQDLGENFVVGLKLDKPVGATIRYPSGTGHPFAGSVADLESEELTAYLMYKFSNGFSVVGGLRAQQVEGDVFLASTQYDLTTNNDREYGYMLGVAYEKPEIALRVSLTYSSAIDHTFSASEAAIIPVAGVGNVPVSREGDFDTTIPQSVNLAFQTGIAEDTLLFGSIRWVDWSEFNINPSLYDQIIQGASGGFSYPLASYQSDTITYKLGIGRRFNENWSGAVTLIHEPESGDIFGNLGPIDGRDAIALGVTYSNDRFKISGGLEYSRLGDAESQTPFGAPGTAISDFTDNSSISYGIRIGYYF